MIKKASSMVLAVIVSLALVAAGCGGAAAVPQVGDKAPDFTLKTVDGESLRLGDHRGKAVLIVFTAVYCKQCEAQMPYIEAAYEQSPDTLAVLFIYREDPVSRVSKHVSDKQLTTFPALPDPDDKVAVEYGLAPKVAPVNFFIDADGFIRHIKPGPLESQDELEGWLDSL